MSFRPPFFYIEPPNAGKCMMIIHEGEKKNKKICISSRKRNRRRVGVGVGEQ